MDEPRKLIRRGDFVRHRHGVVGQAVEHEADGKVRVTTKVGLRTWAVSEIVDSGDGGNDLPILDFYRSR